MEEILKITYYIIFVPVFLYGLYFVLTGLALFKTNKNRREERK